MAEKKYAYCYIFPISLENYPTLLKGHSPPTLNSDAINVEMSDQFCTFMRWY